ncbi:kinesin-like protein KIFC3 [Protobothrops mucrosquamatus]|uniref:kinesin-like protein KIFC3 n=1 Tax=Protobothrops mucrosquamatus TaxID=103944 RepID=UPI0010FB3B6C|nr:kinesin-like protein KIFC3 [Protobothrops mucrosquamatus]
MMLQLFSFLERYTQLQQLQEKAGEYRSRLHWEESRWRRQKRALKRACQQRVTDKLGVIQSLEAIILEQQGLLEKMQAGSKLPSSGQLCPVAPGGLHQLVESLSALQGERSRLAEEVTGLQQRVEEREREKQQLARTFHHQPPESPLVQMMLQLFSFLERYTQLQQLQEKAGEYRSRLHWEESRWRRQKRALKRACQQRVTDKLGVIQSLEAIILEQQGLLEKMQAGSKLPSSGLLCPVAPGGLHQLVESLSALQGERSRLAEEVMGLQQRVEEREREKQQLARSFHHQIRGLKQQIQTQEEEREQIRLGMGVTDSEKRIHNLTMENEGLKQSLQLSQGLLQQAAALSAQPSTGMTMENEALRSQVLQLEASLQQKVEELMYLEERLDRLQGLREGEVRQLEKQLCGLQLPREGLKSPPPAVQGPAKGLPADPPQELQALAQAEEQNRLLMQQLSSQAQRCQQLAEQLQSSEGAAAALRHKISAYEKEVTGLRQELLQEIHRLEEQKEEAVQEACRGSEERARPLCQQLAGMKQHLHTLRPFLQGLRLDFRSFRGEVGSFAQCYKAAIEEAKVQMFSVIREVAQSSRCLQERYQREVQLRKKYHDQLLELKGNIRVLCRLKPLTEEEQQEGSQGGPGVEASPAEDGCVTACYKGKEHRFRLDKIFLPCATQEEVFLEIEPVVLSCLQGYNVCIFAYGQTGSGKTYTMEGHPGNPGITQRALQALYQEMEAKQAEAWTFSAQLTLVEIYNEVIRDLLTKDPQEKLDIKLHPDGSGQLHVPGLTSVEVQNFSEIQKILQLGKRNRTTFSTHMNAHSSRSHALLTLTLTGTELSSGTKVTGKLNLVDLAGSERVWKSGAQGERLKEAQSINRSLLALGEVIQALRSKQAHVPFRNSKLTYLLQDSLGKGSKTVMMVQISPLERNVGESICSLKFAQRVCKVELGPASRRIKAPDQREV